MVRSHVVILQDSSGIPEKDAPAEAAAPASMGEAWVVNCHEIVRGCQEADGRTTVRRARAALPTEGVKPGGQRLGTMARARIGATVSPLAQQGLDEVLGFAIVARGIGADPEDAAGRRCSTGARTDRQRTRSRSTCRITVGRQYGRIRGASCGG